MKERYRFLKHYINCPAGHQREGNHPRETLFFVPDLRRIGRFSIVQNFIESGNKLYNCKKKCTTAKEIVQLQTKLYNCKINGTTAKLYVGIIQEISTTAKKMAQLQKKSTTAKTNAQLQTQMHSCKTHLLQLYYYLFPCSYVTQQWPS
jgi:hypothetical protein